MQHTSPGSYFPPPVLAVSIPKKDGAGERILGVPTVGDCIAQMVVKRIKSFCAAKPAQKVCWADAGAFAERASDVCNFHAGQAVGGVRVGRQRRGLAECRWMVAMFGMRLGDGI